MSVLDHDYGQQRRNGPKLKMSVQDKPITNLYTGGFAKRLNSILDALGLPNPGRYAYIKNVTGMGHSNSRSIFINDRPPKNQTFQNNLVTHLAQALTTKSGTDIPREEVLSFLLTGNGHIGLLVTPDDPILEKAVSAIPLVFQSKLALVVNEIGQKKGINVLEDIDRTQLTLLLKKMSVYAHQYDADMKSEVFKTVVLSAIILAEHTLL
ncbi:MAG: hypothetical protein ACJAU1_000436 [Psychromonas sp.]|jgi:hypothetical protein